MICPITLIALISATVPFVGMGDVQPAALFSDKMVIQRETQLPVWGLADAGEVVTVRASWGASRNRAAGQQRFWLMGKSGQLTLLNGYLFVDGVGSGSHTLTPKQ